ncbi:MAG TPA: MarR family transcriptional regulator [Acholeplasmataceae bacterium]|jgi:DNA-binding MarR family transcriptional regulator|nr:MarR family transcriptional regulator [Acholeplasmataceae bacterium]
MSKKVSSKKEVVIDEKVMQKKMEEAFDYLVNMARVVEERTMDTKNIPDLTIGELYVIETVSKNNNKPMSFIANKLKVSVGALTTGVNRIVKKGYLNRIRDIEDHRVVRLAITPQGRKVLRVHDKGQQEILNEILSRVSLEEAYRVFTTAAEVIENYYLMKEGNKYEK